MRRTHHKLRVLQQLLKQQLKRLESFLPATVPTSKKIIKEYLLNNPEILYEVQSALESKMEKEQAEKTKKAISENAKAIYRDPNAALGGNP